MFIAQIDIGKMMYLTECLGGSFFWGPSKAHAYANKKKKLLKKLAIKHLPNNILKEAIEIALSCLIYVEVPIDMNGERWFLREGDAGEYYFDDDWVMAHGFDTKKEAIEVGEKICEEIGLRSELLKTTTRL